MKKHILAIAAFLLVAGTVTVVSCNKDNEPAQKINNTTVTMKAAAGFDNLGEKFNEFFMACDEAYRNDEAAFLAACEESDEGAFMELTGLGEEYLAEFCERAQESLEEYMSETPKYVPADKACERCTESALKVIGELAASTSGEMMKLMPESFMDYDYYHIFDAVRWYKGESPFKMATSVMAHVSEYFKEIQKEFLNTELQVAKLNGVPKEGEKLTLMFDEGRFKEEYETVLGETTGNKWVAEDVTAYWYLDKENGELLPVMKIAAFNVDEERSSTLYLLSKALPTGNYMFSLVGRGSTTVECIASGDCATSWTAGCDLEKIGSFDWDCSSCIYEQTTGGCRKQESSSSNLFAAYNVMYNILH